MSVNARPGYTKPPSWGDRIISVEDEENGSWNLDLLSLKKTALRLLLQHCVVFVIYWMMNHPGCSLSHCCQRSSDDCHVTITYFYALLLRSYSCWMSLSKVMFPPYAAPAFQTFATLRICAPILSNAASAHKHHFRTLYKQLTSMLAYYPADEC